VAKAARLFPSLGLALKSVRLEQREFRVFGVTSREETFCAELRKVAQVLYDTKGDTGRIILDTLRNATRPLPTSAITEAVMRVRGLDTNDKALCRLMMRRTTANLKHWQKKRGLIRSMPGPGQQLLWEIVR